MITIFQLPFAVVLGFVLTFSVNCGTEFKKNSKITSRYSHDK